MLLLLAASPTLACDPTLLGKFSHPSQPPAEMKVLTTSGKVDGVPYAGAQVTFRSASSPSAWRRVLEHPELQPQWHPKELGTERVDRLEGTDFYQRTAISVLGYKVRRQLIAQVHWLEADARELHTCWNAGRPEEFAGYLGSLDDGSTWQRRGMGGWVIEALPDGGSLVDYQVWVSADVVPTSLMQWAVSRTLPTLLGAFETRTARLDAAAG